ncbi:MAG: glutathione S-transferase family protein [Sulfitobacter sp.]
MEYVLHYAPDNASLIIRLALEHLGLPYRSVLVDRAAKAQTSPAYRALNPNGLIPVLETPQGALFETGAILLWLADRHGGLGPVPGAPERGDFLKWLFFTSNTLHTHLRMMFYPEKFIADGNRDALVAGLAPQITQSLAQLDALAATRRDWFNADYPGALGFYTATCLRWCALYPLETDRTWFSLDDTPHLRALCAAIETLPSAQSAIIAEGLGPQPFTRPAYPTPPEGSAL